MEFVSSVVPVLYTPRRTLAGLRDHPRQVRYAAAMLIVHSLVAISKMLYFHTTGQPVRPPPFKTIYRPPDTTRRSRFRAVSKSNPGVSAPGRRRNPKTDQ